MSNQRPPRAGGLSALAIAWVLGLGGALGVADPARDFVPFLAGLLVAGVGWWGLLRLGPRLSARQVGALLALGVLARAAAWCFEPDLSRDLDRYVYEGRVAWWGGLGFPFRVPPSEAPLHGVPPALLDHAWSRINHPEIPTLYPPLAQLVFVSAGALDQVFGHAAAWLKALLIVADLGTLWILFRLHRVAALGWALAPVAILETAKEGHADVLSALGLALLIVGFTKPRPKLGYLGLALAALGKLNGLALLPAALRSWRRDLWPLALLVLVGLPWMLAGPTALTGLSEYASRWRAGDGAFSLLLPIAEALLGGEWRHFGRFTVTQHQLARGLALVLWMGGSAWILRRPAPITGIPERAGALLLLLLLLSPTFHPWYAIWLLPFVASNPRAFGAAAWLLGIAPLLHLPAHLEATTGTWTDPHWSRALVHLPAWALWGWSQRGQGDPRQERS
ncbi:MAG: hypothetical protein IPG45_22740 [Deltaproteobacteria bacterium]|nr:hypothetical protein [Deltaproteobacteria bacterium]